MNEIKKTIHGNWKTLLKEYIGKPDKAEFLLSEKALAKRARQKQNKLGGHKKRQ